MKTANGVILYRGPSMLDGAPIVVVATGIDKARRGNAKGANRKTGAMVQTYIIRDDMAPQAAIESGADASICGDCVHRGDGTGKGRTCYVTIFQGPRVVFSALHRGTYAMATDADYAALAGLPIRFGTYGDPAAAPLALWQRLQALASITTGYTHQWRTMAAEWSGVVMASADTEADRDAAHAMGYRTFRVALDAERIRGEVRCPASKEAGQKLTCADCGACGGNATGRKSSIVIQLHGANAGKAGQAAITSRLIARG